MRKILLIAIMAILSLTATAQEKKPLFMGIPIEGTKEDFGKQLKSKGFTFDSNTGMYRGEFAGKDVEVGMFTTKKSNQVYQVLVAFGKKDSWATYVSNFDSLKSILDKKYKPISHTKRFFSPYYNGDGYELQALRKNKVLYKADYSTRDQSILRVEMMLMYQFGIVISYKNLLLTGVNEEEEKEETYNDL